MGRVFGVELRELIQGLCEVPLAGVLVATDAAHVCNLSSAEPI